MLLHRPRSLLLVPTKEQSMTVLVAPIRSTILARSAFTRRSDIRPLAVVLAMTPPARPQDRLERARAAGVLREPSDELQHRLDTVAGSTTPPPTLAAHASSSRVYSASVVLRRGGSLGAQLVEHRPSCVPLEGRPPPAHLLDDSRSLLVGRSAALVTAGVYEAGATRLDLGAQPKHTATARASHAAALAALDGA